MKNSKKIHFLHIGKTGGTALRHVLKPFAQRVDWLHLHGHTTRLQDVPEGEAVCFFLRDPVSRFLSGFYSRQRKGQPRYNSRWSEAEALAFGQFESANALALALSSSDNALRAVAQAAMRGIQHIKDSYWFWLGSENYLMQRQADIVLIGQQVQLEHDVRVLGHVLELSLSDLPTDPVQAHKNPEQTDKHLDAQAILNLQTWYADDYAAIAACRALVYRMSLPGSLAEGIVTLADSHYYPGIETLYLSVQQSYPVPITCFDVGLTDEQKVHARTHYPLLNIRPLPAIPEIDRIKTVFENAKPLGKAGKRVWPLWICPFLIAASPYRRVFWLDGDLVVLRGLPQLFAMLDSGPVFTLENNAPEQTANRPELYELLPTGREASPTFDRTHPPVNGGVSGWDLVRDGEALQAYMNPILHACDDPGVRDAIAWHDQGALIWAIQRHALEHRVLQETRWNLCVRHSSVVAGKRYKWGAAVLDELRTDEPDACLLHWNGRKVPWLT